MQIGGASSGAFVSESCMRNASLTRSAKSLVLGSMQGNPDLPAVAKPMCRLFGPSGGAASQGVPAAADIYASSREGTDSAEWVAHRKAKKKGGDKQREKEERGRET